MSDNYLELTVEEVYSIIIGAGVWPEYFDKEKKKFLLSKLLDYYAGRDEFEKCTLIQKAIDELENTKPGRRSMRNNPN
jgi:hypothetical protein